MYLARARNLRSLALKYSPVSYSTQSEAIPKYESLGVTETKPYVFHVELNRPDKLNALNNTMWMDIGTCFSHLAQRSDCRVIVLSAAGRLFTAGIDVKDMAQLGSTLGEHDDIARRANALRKTIKLYQDSISSLEKCPKPVITAIHNACIGAGVDLITAADIRFCTKDAWFQIKETDIGMAADVGTLQRFPKVIGSDSLARELVYSARKFSSEEAKECGLVSRVYDDKESMLSGALELAENIASKSPVATQVSKRNLIFSRDHSVQDGLDHIRDWNMSMLQSEDLVNAVMAQATKNPSPSFSKL